MFSGIVGVVVGEGVAPPCAGAFHGQVLPTVERERLVVYTVSEKLVERRERILRREGQFVAFLRGNDGLVHGHTREAEHDGIDEFIADGHLSGECAS